MNKVLILATTAAMIEQFNMPNIDLLQELGFEVQVACNFRNGNPISNDQITLFQEILKEKNVKYHQVELTRKIVKIFTNLKAFKQADSILKEEDFKFVHCHTPVGGVCGRIIGHRNNVNVIYTAHGFHFYKGAKLVNWLLYYPIEKLLSKYTSHLITINEEDYNATFERSFKAKNVSLFPGAGINLERFTPCTQSEKNELRKEYGYNEKDFILIHVAELNKNKNQELVVRAVSKIRSEIPDLKLLLVGIGSMENEYKKLCKTLHIEDRVIFLGYRTDVQNLMKVANVGVSASYREGLPVNVMEAMATGLPLVVTNCRGNRDLITHEKNGFLIKQDDIVGFSKAIKTLYQDECLREKFSCQNKADIQTYDAKNIMRLTKQVYISEMDDSTAHEKFRK